MSKPVNASSDDSKNVQVVVPSKDEGPDENIVLGRDGDRYVIVDRDAGVQVRMTRGGAKAACRFLMQELNIKEARLATGEDVFEKDEKLKAGKDAKVDSDKKA